MGTRRGVMMAARAAVVALVVARCCLPLARAAPVVDAEILLCAILPQDRNPHALDADILPPSLPSFSSHSFIVGCKGSLVSPLPTALLALSHLKTLSTCFPSASLFFFPQSTCMCMPNCTPNCMPTADAPLKHIISNPLPPSFPSSPLSPLPALSPPCRLPFSPPCLPAHQCSSTASHGNLKASVPQELGNLQQLTRLSVRLGGGGM
ncbi:unnamed protein product [Closterium sp. NIES-64]|nr:unnamed protein product [Closterium sp. NIES-64]